MDKAALAGQYFMDGYNCAQAVALAFHEEMGMETDAVARLASGFGGGIGRMREVCGALSGAVLVLNFLRGYDDPQDPSAKARYYGMIQLLCGDFRKAMGSCICRELLGTEADGSPVPDKRDPAFYEKRPCLRAVREAASLAEKYLSIL